MSKKSIVVTKVCEGHDNPIAELVQVACKFDSEITLESDNRKINAKSIMGIMAFNPSDGMSVDIVTKGDVYGKPAIVTDTHCIRLCNRIGLVDGIKDPKKVEMELWKIIPPEESNDFCHRLVDHGRAVCTARTTPHCDMCVLNDICGSVVHN